MCRCLSSLSGTCRSCCEARCAVDVRLTIETGAYYDHFCVHPRAEGGANPHRFCKLHAIVGPKGPLSIPVWETSRRTLPKLEPSIYIPAGTSIYHIYMHMIFQNCFCIYLEIYICKYIRTRLLSLGGSIWIPPSPSGPTRVSPLEGAPISTCTDRPASVPCAAKDNPRLLERCPGDPLKKAWRALDRPFWQFHCQFYLLVCIYMYICIDVYVYIHIYIYAYIYRYIYTYIYIYKNMCVYTCICVYTRYPPERSTNIRYS